MTSQNGSHVGRRRRITGQQGAVLFASPETAHEPARD